MLTRLTIVKDDNLVRIDHRSLQFDLSPFSLPDNFHALQWYEDMGEMEFNDGNHNEQITDITPFQPIIDEFMRLEEIEDNPPPPTEREKYTRLIRERNGYLNQTDWITIRHIEQTENLDIEPTSLTDEAMDELLLWRQQLRELSEMYNNSDDWEWPDPPGFLIPKYLQSYSGSDAGNDTGH